MRTIPIVARTLALAVVACLLVVGCSVASAQAPQRLFVPLAYRGASEGLTVTSAAAQLALTPLEFREAAGHAGFQDLTVSGAIEEAALVADCADPAASRVRLRDLGFQTAYRSVLRGESTATVSRAEHIVATYGSAGSAHYVAQEMATCPRLPWQAVGIEPVGQESRAWISVASGATTGTYRLLFLERDSVQRIDVTATVGGGLDALIALGRIAATKANPATPTPPASPTTTASPTATPTVTPTVTRTATPTATPSATPTTTPTITATQTPTSTSTVTFTATATPTATPPPGLEIASGRSAVASSSTADHPAGHAVDVLSGGPNGQNATTYWLARLPASASGNQLIRVTLDQPTSISAIQARLSLAASGMVSARVDLRDFLGTTIWSSLTLVNGIASDNQTIGLVYGTPVPNVQDVYVVFTDSPPGVAPGLRTLGVYTP